MTKEKFIKKLKTSDKDSFGELAMELFNKFEIRKTEKDFDGTERVVHYDFAEIEFYYFHKEEWPDRYTYIRRKKAGEWFFHGSGLDICFESEEVGDELVSFGGILIRSLVRHDGSTKEGELIRGPFRCQDELLNNAVGMFEWGEKEIGSDPVVPETTIRNGLSKDDKRNAYREMKWCFFIPRDDWGKSRNIKSYRYQTRKEGDSESIEVRKCEMKQTYRNPMDRK